MISQVTTVGASAGHTDVDLWYVLDSDAEVSVAVDGREFAEWRWWTVEEVLAADPAVLTRTSSASRPSSPTAWKATASAPPRRSIKS